MRTRFTSLVACAALAALAGLAQAQQLEPNSFVKKPVTTTEALVQHVSTDSEVMSRFMRHFGMARDEVIAYLKSLRPGTVQEDGTYLIYNTPESGEIRARVLFYKKGTPVFVDENGNYILKMSCGNPMVRGTDLAQVDQTETTAMRSLTSIRDLSVSQPPGISTTSVTGMAVTPPIAEYDAIAIAEIEPAMPVMPETAAQVIVPLGLLIPFTGGILYNDRGGEPIPEPASLIALGAGVAGLAALRRRRKVA